MFDLSIKFKSAANLDGITFTSFAKEELESIEEYLLMKKIRVKNETEDVAAPELIAALESDDDDDAGDSDADDGPKKVKAAGGDLREEDDEDSEGSSTLFHTLPPFLSSPLSSHGIAACCAVALALAVALIDVA